MESHIEPRTQRWCMVIDLEKCIGCDTCSIVCKEVNNATSDVFWRRVADLDGIQEPRLPRTFLPYSCMQCSEPPCFDVCPTTATYIRPDGIVDIHADLCIGCGYCIVACPYLARSINTYDLHPLQVPEHSIVSANGKMVDRTGTCTKCDFCWEKVERGRAQGLQPGLDAGATPSCVASCPAGALYFGDFSEPDSRVSQFVTEGPAYSLLEDMGTRPAIFYLPPSSTAGWENQAEVQVTPPVKQTVWRLPAAINFTLGGLGAGLYLLVAFLAVLGNELPGYFELAAPSLIGLGLFSLVFEAGQPWRSYHLLRHLRRSWMSRETLAALIFIPAAILDWAFPHPILSGLASLSAAAFMISQGFILLRSQAVRTWTHPLVPVFFVTSGLSMAAGLLLTAGGFMGFLTSELYGVAAVSGAFNMIVWLAYVFAPGDGEYKSMVAALRSRIPLTLTIVLGHLLPVLVVLSLWVRGSAPASVWMVLAGIGLLYGGAKMKFDLILRAGFLAAIVLRKAKNLDIRIHPHRISYPVSSRSK